MNKRKVYNGYEEKYMTGKEIKDFLSDAYETYGKHHTRISLSKINFNFFPKIKDDILYRVFFNNLFIKIFDAETDESLYFIGYTKK